MQTQEIYCRAYDSSQNTQPNTFTWNLMGMMNNCVYRVKVRCCLLHFNLYVLLRLPFGLPAAVACAMCEDNTQTSVMQEWL